MIIEGIAGWFKGDYGRISNALDYPIQILLSATYLAI